MALRAGSVGPRSEAGRFTRRPLRAVGRAGLRVGRAGRAIDWAGRRVGGGSDSAGRRGRPLRGVGEAARGNVPGRSPLFPGTSPVGVSPPGVPGEGAPFFPRRARVLAVRDRPSERRPPGRGVRARAGRRGARLVDGRGCAPLPAEPRALGSGAGGAGFGRRGTAGSELARSRGIRLSN